jgi:hypothetical protein
MGSEWGGVRVTGSSTSSRICPLPLLRHRDDLPGAGQILEHQVAEAKAAEAEAQAVLRQVQVEALEPSGRPPVAADSHTRAQW